jgi:hypothetical protein
VLVRLIQADNRTSATSLPIARGTKASHLDGGDTSRGTKTTWQPGGPTHDSIRAGVRSDYLSDRQEEQEDTCSKILT